MGQLTTHNSIRAGQASRLDAESVWDARAEQWCEIASTEAFRGFRDAVLADLGCGTGLLTIPIAARGAHAVGLDVSTEMLRLLRAHTGRVASSHVELIHGDMRSLPIADGSIDAVVSCYAFHHLTDADKRVALAEVARVLRPGGRVVIADMMFRIGTSRRDRRIVASKIALLVRKGPAGVIRLLRNVGRYATGRWEHPAPIRWWEQALADAGFTVVTARPLAYEAGLAVAVRPHRAAGSNGATRPTG